MGVYGGARAWREIERFVVVIDGRIRMCYLCFTYTLVSTVSFVLLDSEGEERERST